MAWAGSAAGNAQASNRPQAYLGVSNIARGRVGAGEKTSDKRMAQTEIKCQRISVRLGGSMSFSITSA